MSAQPSVAASKLRAQPGERVVVVYHGDADGISSAALCSATLERSGAVAVGLTPAKGRDVYDARFQAELKRARPDSVIVVDTGSRAGFAWDLAPTTIVDHHPTESPPHCARLVHDVDAPSTSLLAWRLVCEVADMNDRAWLAAIGALGDAGDAARAEPIVARAAKSHGIGVLRSIVALVNAAGRAAEPANEVAYEALSEASTPRDVLASAILTAKREEVATAIAHARRVPPKVVGRWAIIELDDPCRIHGVIASTWARRLAPRITLVANRGYMPGRVHLSVRAGGDIDVRAALRAIMPEEGPSFAAGHAQASGAVLGVATYEALLGALERIPQRHLPSTRPSGRGPSISARAATVQASASKKNALRK